MGSMICPNCGSADVMEGLWAGDSEFDCQSCNYLWYGTKKSLAGKAKKIDLICQRILEHMEDGDYVGCVPTSFNLAIMGCSFTTLQRAFRFLETQGKMCSFTLVVRGQMVTCYVHIGLAMERASYGNRLNNV